MLKLPIIAFAFTTYKKCVGVDEVCSLATFFFLNVIAGLILVICSRMSFPLISECSLELKAALPFQLK